MDFCSKGFCKGFSKEMTHSQILFNNEAWQGRLDSDKALDKKINHSA